MLQLVAGLEYCFSLSHSKLCFLHEATFLGGEEKRAEVGMGMGGWGRSREEEERKMQGKKEKEDQKGKLVFRSGRGGRSETNSRSRVVAEKIKEERKARRGRIGAETKGQRDRQRQVEKNAET